MNQFKGEPFQARLEKLNQQKGFLHRLNQIIPWEEFRLLLERIRDKPRSSRAGIKPNELYPDV